MRVITASEYGPAEVLRVEDRPVPKPKRDEVVVEVKAAGINLMDSYARRGLVPTYKLPISVGVEGQGSWSPSGISPRRRSGTELRGSTSREATRKWWQFRTNA